MSRPEWLDDELENIIRDTLRYENGREPTDDEIWEAAQQYNDDWPDNELDLNYFDWFAEEGDR